jgi:hypothetical protein
MNSNAEEWAGDHTPDTTRVKPRRICDIVRPKESAMLKWLVSLWHKIEGWRHPRQPVPNSYHPSNLHGRHR